MSESKSRGLTRAQFDEVIRRASELAARGKETDGSDLTESEVFRIAREVGLSDAHVTTALTELRANTLRNENTS